MTLRRNNYDHETTLESIHWIEFWRSEREELRQEQKLLKILIVVFIAILLIIGFILRDTILVIVSIVSGVLFSIVCFVARRINNYFRYRILQADPVVKLNRIGYQIGKSFRAWPSGSEIIAHVILDERPHIDVLEIQIMEREICFHSIKIPFNKQDIDISQYYKKHLSNRT